MRRIWWFLAGVGIAGIAAGAAGIAYVRSTGLDSQPQPGLVEASVARLARGLAISREVASMRNPVTLTPEVLAEGMAHFADHCASCHADDGSGNTALGRGLYPKAPDMRSSATQRLSDGELFYVIEHGIRFTGMPAWSTGTADGETASWQLVHAIRRLPRLTAVERGRMETLTPRSPEAVRQEIEEEEFLNGGDEPPPSTHPH